MKSYASAIRQDTCDSCGRRGATAITKEDDTPIYGICAGCDPDSFEHVARANIDAWLGGEGPAEAFG